MAQSDVMAFILGTFAPVKSFQLWVMLGGAEGGAQGFHAAFAHFGLSFPLTTFFEPRFISHKGLEPAGRLAIAPALHSLAPSSRISSFALFVSTVLDNLVAISLDSPAGAR